MFGFFKEDKYRVELYVRIKSDDPDDIEEEASEYIDWFSPYIVDTNAYEKMCRNVGRLDDEENMDSLLELMEDPEVVKEFKLGVVVFDHAQYSQKPYKPDYEYTPDDIENIDPDKIIKNTKEYVRGEVIKDIKDTIEKGKSKGYSDKHMKALTKYLSIVEKMATGIERAAVLSRKFIKVVKIKD